MRLVGAVNISILLDKYSVDQYQGEWNYEQDVREVEDKLAHIVLCAESLGIPVSDAHLEISDIPHIPSNRVPEYHAPDLLKLTRSSHP